MIANNEEKKELNFLDAVSIFDNDDDKRTVVFNKDYYDLLKSNKEYFQHLTTEEILIQQTSQRGKSNENIVIAKLKAFKKIKFTSRQADLRKCNVYIVTVPTPIFSTKKPNLNFLKIVPC